MFDPYLDSFLKLFVIMDAVGLVPVFLLLSEKLPRKQRTKAADKTLFVATVLALLFIFAGIQVLNFFGITLSSFQIAGGIILFVIGIKTVLGLKIGNQQKRAEHYEFTSVPMATPLIVGPGTITTLIILVAAYGYTPVLLAAVLNLLIMWGVLRYSSVIYNFMGHQGAEVVSRVMGIIFTALAIEFIKAGFIGLAG